MALQTAEPDWLSAGVVAALGLLASAAGSAALAIWRTATQAEKIDDHAKRIALLEVYSSQSTAAFSDLRVTMARIDERTALLLKQGATRHE